jgi:hypothetical protein
MHLCIEAGSGRFGSCSLWATADDYWAMTTPRVGQSLSIMTPARPPETAHNSSISSSPKSSGGKSPASQRSGRTKTPQLLPHSKYRLPLTEPSFLPVGSSSVTPIQAPMPGISGTRPAYETVPLRASDSGRRRTRVETVRPRCCQRCPCYDVLHLTCWAPSSRGEPARSAQRSATLGDGAAARWCIAGRRGASSWSIRKAARSMHTDHTCGA